jgi:hypothetical protein
MLAELDILNNIIRPFSKLIKALIRLTAAGDLALKKLEDTEAAVKARVIRAKATQRRVTQGGMITVAEARTHIENRREIDKNKEAARLKRVERRCRMDWTECVEALTRNLRNQWRDDDRGQLFPWLRHKYGIEY